MLGLSKLQIPSAKSDPPSIRVRLDTYLAPHAISEFASDVQVGVGLQLVLVVVAFCWFWLTVVLAFSRLWIIASGGRSVTDAADDLLVEQTEYKQMAAARCFSTQKVGWIWFLNNRFRHAESQRTEVCGGSPGH